MEFQSIFTMNKTAMDYAKEKNHQEIIQILLKGPKQTNPEQPVSNPDTVNQKIEELQNTIVQLNTIKFKA